MNALSKKMIVSPVIGVLAYLIIGFIEQQTLNIPSTPTDLVVLITIIAAVMIGAMLSGSRVSVPSASGEETGTVKWFNVKKGYGFITRDQGDDVFVHYRNIQGQGRRAIAEGQRVRFVVINGDKGLQADEVEAL